jgi:hypothetical protein
MAAWAKAHPTTAYAESIFWVPAPDQVGGKHTKKKEYPIRHRRTFGIEQGISNDEVRFFTSLCSPHQFTPHQLAADA